MLLPPWLRPLKSLFSASRPTRLMRRSKLGSARLAVERLEDRTVPSGLTPDITEFLVANGGNVAAITKGPDGNLWFTEGDGEYGGNLIGKLNPTTGDIATYNIPTPYSSPGSITAGPYGNLWFTENQANQIGRLDPTTGQIDEFLIPSPGSFPTAITAGPDGALWFTEEIGKVGRIDPGTGAITEFTGLSSGPWSNQLLGITAGPDGNLWITNTAANKIARMTPTGDVTEFNIPSIPNPDDPSTPSFAVGITAGPDGNLWFTEANTQKIGRITPAGAITEFALPATSNPYVGPRSITTGADGNLWFTVSSVDGGEQYIGTITPSGTNTELFPVPLHGNSFGPLDISSGPDGNIWFTNYPNYIDKLVINQSAVTTTALNAPTVTYGQNGLVTVTVSSATGTPTGAVALSVDGGAPLSETLSNGVALFNVGALAAGDHTLLANYAAQDNFEASSQSGTLHVSPVTLTANASTQGAINISKAGVLTFAIDLNQVPGFIVNGVSTIDNQTVSGLFAGASFSLAMSGYAGSLTDVKATVVRNVVYVSMRMDQPLYDFLKQGVTSTETNAAKASLETIELSAISNDGNYALNADVLTRLFQAGKVHFS